MDYLVIGAGPAGLQLGWFLHQTGRDYVILEAGSTPGTSYRRYPHRRRMSAFGQLGGDAAAGPPDPDEYVRYLTDFAAAHELKIRYHARVTLVARDDERDRRFVVIDQSGHVYRAKRVIVAAGLGRPYLPPIPGIEAAERYDEAEVDPADFAGRRVLVIGKGEMAFATAAGLAERAAMVHVVGPRSASAAQVAHLTDLTGHDWAGSEILLDPLRRGDHDAVLDATIRRIERVCTDDEYAGEEYAGEEYTGEEYTGEDYAGEEYAREEYAREPRDDESEPEEYGDGEYGGRYAVTLSYARQAGRLRMKTVQLRYDRIIACTGFQMDSTIFDTSCRPEPALNGRLPALTSEWESVNVPDLYFAGALTRVGAKEHSGALLHGLRYCVRALRRMLDRKYEGIEWPYRELQADPETLTTAVLNRINRSPGLFQRFAVLCDLIVVEPYAGLARYYEEMPVDYVHDSLFGSADRYFTITLEYGEAAGRPDPHDDRYLRPVVRHYRRWALVAVQRLPEDMDNDWADEEEYRAPMRSFFAQQMALTFV